MIQLVISQCPFHYSTTSSPQVRPLEFAKFQVQIERTVVSFPKAPSLGYAEEFLHFYSRVTTDASIVANVVHK
jgi:hypothetical protein